MICRPAISPRRSAMVKIALRGLSAASAVAAVTLAGCAQHVPKGQVLAVVNGQDVTSQDLATEERSLGRGHADPQVLMQRVVARVLLAQSAHARKLDTYPAYPSDMARIQQTFLAQRLLQTTVKPPEKPSPAELQSFMAAHPFSFARRMKIRMDELRFQSGDDLKSLNGADGLAGIEARLKRLNTPVEHQVRTVDTAQLPAPLAEKLASTPAGQVFFVHEGDTALGISIQARDPVSAPPEVQAAMAGQMMSELSTQKQVEAQVAALRNRAKIAYQPGYAPPAPHAAPAGPAAGR